MNLTTRRLKRGWAVYQGRVRYLTTTYPTKRQAVERIEIESAWAGLAHVSVSNTNPVWRRRK